MTEAQEKDAADARAARRSQEKMIEDERAKAEVDALVPDSNISFGAKGVSGGLDDYNFDVNKGASPEIERRADKENKFEGVAGATPKAKPSVPLASGWAPATMATSVPVELEAPFPVESSPNAAAPASTERAIALLEQAVSLLSEGVREERAKREASDARVASLERQIAWLVQKQK
jgi:hypothetical protein